MIFESLQISQTPHFRAIYDTETSKNIINPAFQSNLRYFESLTPQITKTNHLGYNQPHKNTPNQEYELFGIHLPPQKHPKSSIQAFGMQSEAKMHPKSRIRAIWDTFTPSKTSQIINSKHLGYEDFEKYHKYP